MTQLINSLEREWPVGNVNSLHEWVEGKGIVENRKKERGGPVATLAEGHEPYSVSIWDRLAPEERRRVLRLKGAYRIYHRVPRRSGR